MKRHLIFLIILCFTLSVAGQITTEPAFPVAGQSVKIIFDSKKETRLGAFSEDLYAHTGVGVEGDGNWQYVIGQWGQNAAQPKLTFKGDGIYELVITPSILDFYKVPGGKQVVNLSFVFRNSAGNKQTNDLFVSVYQNGLNVDLLFPSNNFILQVDEHYTFSAIAGSAANLKLYVDQELVDQNSGIEIHHDFSFSSAGEHMVLVIAESQDGQVVSDSAFICVSSGTPESPRPAGAQKGITYLSDQSLRLVLFAPNKENVFVLGDFNGWKPMNSYQMNRDGDYFWIDIGGLIAGKEYAFQYLIDGGLLVADPYSEKILDPWNDKYISNTTYPGLLQHSDGEIEQIATVVKAGQQPYQWEVEGFTIPAKNQLIIYELLIRDFTDEHSFQAVIDKLDYLEDLQINVLELMPVNEFEGNSSWGYNPSFYFAPDKYYGPKDDLKRLVDECHKRGIAVVIDMVLNHSYGQSPLVKMYWNPVNKQPSADNPWYNVVSNFQNPDAQWGYDFNHESTYTRELVDSINSFWMNEYRIDGFRFDFTKGFSNTPYPANSWGSDYDSSRISNLKRMADEIWRRKPGALVICEHLADNSEEKELAGHGLLFWGNMNYNYGESAMGYLENNKSNLSGAIYSYRGWNEPNLIAYQESHDEERLTYKCLTWGNAVGNYDIKQFNTAIDRMKLNAAFHLLLPGPKMIWQFGELGYDYSINTCEDAVTVSDGCRLATKPVRWDYTLDQDRVKLYRVYADLNYLKRNYEEFSSEEFTYSLSGALKKIVYVSDNNYVVVLGNFSLDEEVVTLSLPVSGRWFDYYSKESFTVSNASLDLSLAPGEFKIFSTREFLHANISAVGSQSVVKPTICVFPNPANSQLFILGEQLEIQGVYSVLGEKTDVLVYWQTDGVNLDISSLRKGIYIVRGIVRGGQYFTSKFIKE
jgi:1,4-alpha-glucan branching enzyme